MNGQVEPIEYNEYGRNSMSRKTQKTLWVLATIFGSIIIFIASFYITLVAKNSDRFTRDDVVIEAVDDTETDSDYNSAN